MTGTLAYFVTELIATVKSFPEPSRREDEDRQIEAEPEVLSVGRRRHKTVYRRHRRRGKIS